MEARVGVCVDGESFDYVADDRYPNEIGVVPSANVLGHAGFLACEKKLHDRVVWGKLGIPVYCWCMADPMGDLHVNEPED